jgi:hypothetical protein
MHRSPLFILVPSADHFLHPAHRDPDETVEVWLKSGTVTFENRQLIWASGVFERLPLQRAEDHALYTLSNASVKSASYEDIKNRFAPCAASSGDGTRVTSSAFA